MKKALFYGLGIPAIYFGVACALAHLFGKEASNTSILITFICPLIVTFIVALITEVISEDLASEDLASEDVKPSVYSEGFRSCNLIKNARDVIEDKVVPLLNGTRERSWVNWDEIPDWKNFPNKGYALDLLGTILYQVLREHYASPYITNHTGINYFAEDGFEIRRFV